MGHPVIELIGVNTCVRSALPAVLGTCSTAIQDAAFGVWTTTRLRSLRRAALGVSPRIASISNIIKTPQVVHWILRESRRRRMVCSISLCLKMCLYLQWYHMRYYAQTPVNLHCDLNCTVHHDGFSQFYEPPCDMRIHGNVAVCATSKLKTYHQSQSF